MFTDKTPALSVTSSHPGAWLDLGRVINVPESEGAVPLGHCLPGPGDSALSPGNKGELGKCAGVRPGWATHPATGGASGEGEGAEGRCQGQSLSTTRQASTYPTSALFWPQLFFYQCRLFSPPVKAILLLYHWEKVSFVLKFTEIIGKPLLGRNAYTSLHLHPKFTPESIS